jgi:hypothetical protein
MKDGPNIKTGLGLLVPMLFRDVLIVIQTDVESRESRVDVIWLQVPQGCAGDV